MSSTEKFDAVFSRVMECTCNRLMVSRKYSVEQAVDMFEEWLKENPNDYDPEFRVKPQYVVPTWVHYRLLDDSEREVGDPIAAWIECSSSCVGAQPVWVL